MRPMVLVRLLAAAFAALVVGCASPYSPADPPVAVVPAPELRPGDAWVYEQINPFNGLVARTLTDTLKPAGDGFMIERRSDRPGEALETETIAAPWREVAETVGNARRSFSVPLARIALPIAPGQGWREEATVTDEHGVDFRWRTYGGAIGWEKVKTPAGEFVALRVERQMTLGDYDYQWSDTKVVETYWYVPAVKRWVRLEHRYERVELRTSPRSRRILFDRIIWELKEFRPGS